MLFRYAALIGFCLLIGLTAGAQTDFTTRKTTNKKALKYYTAAGEALNVQRYAEAVAELTKAIEADARFVDAYQDRASAYYFDGRYAEAVADYERVLALAPELDPRLYFYLGETQYRLDRYAEARTNLDAYLQRAGDRKGRLIDKARRLRANVDFAADAVANPVPFAPEKLSESVNLPGRAEYLPVVSVDGQQLIFTAVVRNQEDFFVTERDTATGDWRPARELEGVNTPENEGAQTISADGRTIVFTACNRRGGFGSCDLYYSEQRDGRWTPPANLGATINTRAWESLPALSADGNTLYFSSNRAGGAGGKDLYVSRRSADGNWQAPENLGAPLNTPGDEQSPFLHPDGQTLYFMSDALPGMGGTDLYLSRRTATGAWGAPENLGYPINTKADEGALFITLDGRTAYFATDRDVLGTGASALADPRGGRPTDIYSFELPATVRPKPVTYVRARVFDVATGEPLSARVDFEDLSGDLAPSSARTRPDGTFLLTLPLGRDYALNVAQDGYFFHSENFALSAADADPAQPFALEIGLRPLPPVSDAPAAAPTVESAPIVLRNVLFETGSATLKPVSRAELDRLRDLLNSRPQLRIQLNGHTDNVGSAADNLRLSEDRARAVYDYLVAAGIDPARLRSAGYGETRPLASNDTPAGRRQNRRTAFVVW